MTFNRGPAASWTRQFLTSGALAIALLYAATGLGATPAHANAEDQTPATAAALGSIKSLSLGQMRKLVVHEAPKDFPQTPFVNAAGETVTLGDFTGEIVFVNLWATWCAPCKKEMPSIDRLAGKLLGQPFRVVAISVDQGGAIERAKTFLSDEISAEHLDFYIDDAFAVPREAGAIGLPTSFILDRSGKEVARLVGDAEWDSAEAVAVMERLIKN
ncbi:MAG: TlpA disulfide reductase family protein [Pseudomonadota bacterium]